MGKRYAVVVVMFLYAQLSAAAAAGWVQLFKGPQKVPAGQSVVMGVMFDVHTNETLSASGWFSASGGDDGIFCFLYDEASYRLVKEGQPADAIYSSGRPTAHGEFNVTVPNQGKYFGRCYLMFSNVHSTANKTVWGDIRLIWQEQVPSIPEPLLVMWLAMWVGLGGAAFASKKGQRDAVASFHRRIQMSSASSFQHSGGSSRT